MPLAFAQAQHCVFKQKQAPVLEREQCLAYGLEQRLVLEQEQCLLSTADVFASDQDMRAS